MGMAIPGMVMNGQYQVSLEGSSAVSPPMGWSGTAYLALDLLVKAPTSGGFPFYEVQTTLYQYSSGGPYAVAFINHPTDLNAGQPMVQNPYPNIGISEYTGWRPIAFVINPVEGHTYNIVTDIFIMNTATLPDALFLMDNVRWYQNTADLPSNTVVISPAN